VSRPHGAPRVTVCIPTKDRPDLLAGAIASIREQTVDDWELFVSDNSSDDRSGELVRSLGDPRVVHAPNDGNVGPFANFTRCLRLGTAPLVALLQDDDRFHPSCLERKLAAFDEHPGAAIVHSAFRFLADDGRVLVDDARFWGVGPAVETSTEFLHSTMGGGSRILFSAAVLRRDLVADLEFSEADNHATDVGLWLRAGARGSVVFVDEPLVDSLVHEVSETVSSGNYGWAGGKYMASINANAILYGVKRRFLVEHPELDPDGRLAAEADRYTRKHLLSAAVYEAGTPRRPRAMWSALGRADAVLSGVRTSRAGLRVLAGSLLPGDLRRRVASWGRR
jgi:glycosyltransferase involved in cell wall biosynthesis